jgi:hypothetical protein
MGGRYAGIARLPLPGDFMESLTIKAADKEFVLKDLMVAQIEDIQDALLKPVPEGQVIRKELDRQILSIALSGDYPEMTPEAVGKLRIGSLKKLQQVVRDVLEFAGFEVELKKKETGEPSGEETARAA